MTCHESNLTNMFCMDRVLLTRKLVLANVIVDPVEN